MRRARIRLVLILVKAPQAVGIASPVPAATHLERRALRRRDVCELYGASLAAVDREIRAGNIRTKTVGRSVFLDPADVERVFGFTESVEPSLETYAELKDFLA